MMVLRPASGVLAAASRLVRRSLNAYSARGLALLALASLLAAAAPFAWPLAGVLLWLALLHFAAA